MFLNLICVLFFILLYVYLAMNGAYLSDIVSINGQNILQSAWYGTIPCSSYLRWPSQESPPDKWWSLWRQALTRVYVISSL